MTFLVFVDFLQSISIRTCNWQCSMSLYRWNCVGKVTEYNMYQIIAWKIVTGRQSQCARGLWNVASSSCPAVEVPLIQILSHKNRKERRSSFLMKDGVTLVLSKARKRIVPKMPFVSLSCRIFDFEEVRSNDCLYRNSAPNNSRVSIVLAFEKIHLDVQTHIRQFCFLIRADTKILQPSKNTTRLSNYG